VFRAETREYSKRVDMAKRCDETLDSSSRRQDNESTGASGAIQSKISSVLDEGAKKSIINRLARLSGHLNSIKRMIEEDREVSALLVQLASVRSATLGVERALTIETLAARAKDVFPKDDASEWDWQDLVETVERCLK